MDLESAIPAHLRVARTCPARTPGGLAPPYPTYVARFAPSVDKVVMCYLGVQCQAEDVERTPRIREEIRGLLGLADGPLHCDEAGFTDSAGYRNFLFAAYWTDPAIYQRWTASPAVSKWWDAPARLTDGMGFFREVFAPRAEDFETHFSTLRAEGVAVLSNGMSGEILEHSYWGSARDRIPRSQTDRLRTSDTPSTVPHEGTSLGRRVIVQPRDNLCLIRSGQDWTDSDRDERALYDADIRPHLEAGMAFLSTCGAEVGCYANRFARVTDAAGQNVDKTYGMSLWRSLEALENWAAHHPTHLAIFIAGIAYMRKLGPAAGLRTYHEISVVRVSEQSFEYLNCHPQTGMLLSMGSSEMRSII